MGPGTAWWNYHYQVVMNNRLYIFIIAALAMVSCSKTPAGNDENIGMKLPKYIYFDAAAATKGPLIEDMTGKDFGVIGFKYTSNWDTYKALGTPMAEFYKTTITDSDDRDGVFRYTPLVNWVAGNRYTFFAYYPCEQISTAPTGVSVVGNQSTQNTPRITYTVRSGAKSDQSKLLDVMTAMVKDTDNSSDGVVGFHFYHKLFCIEVVARNYDETPVSIRNANVTFNELTESITIPLDPSISPSTSGTYSNATYNISDSTPISVPTGGASIRISGDDKIILIPRSGLSGKITFTDGNGVRKEESFSSSKDCKPGMKYTLSIAFANNALSVAVIESSEWTDVNQNIVFE